ncbi:MAG: hypothetical protein PF692_10640 [Kiritimatiellae bacterium]|jgi:hypothetical protein|nr:hypothetical protein [Kiritimatiellia bacterium]
MLNRLIVFILLCFVSTSAFSNAIIEIKSDHAKYLKFENIYISVKIKDESYSPIIIGDKDDIEANASVTFQVINSNNKYLPLPLTTHRPFVENLIVNPGQIGSFTFDLTDYYTLNDVGNYKVKAIVTFGGKVFQSNVISLEVFNGMELISVQKLLPGYMDKTREYSLRYMVREGTEVIFFRVDELERGLNYGVVPLGDFIRVVKPELLVDLDGFVKIKYQAGYNCFAICYFLSDITGIEYVDRRYVTREGTPYNFKVSAEQQDRPMPKGDSEVKTKPKRSLWQKLTGQGKEDVKKEEVKPVEE